MDRFERAFEAVNQLNEQALSGLIARSLGADTPRQRAAAEASVLVEQLRALARERGRRSALDRLQRALDTHALTPPVLEEAVTPEAVEPLIGGSIPDDCTWEPGPLTRTLYISNSSTSSLPANGTIKRPYTLDEVREYLDDYGYAAGNLQLLFKRGDVWKVSDEKSDASNNFLTIRRSGYGEELALYIGAYGESRTIEDPKTGKPIGERPAAPDPAFLGEGDLARGLVIEGASYVQIKNLTIKGFGYGVLIWSYADAKNGVPLTGSRNINIIDCKIKRNTLNGIFITSTSQEYVLSGGNHRLVTTDDGDVEPELLDGSPLVASPGEWWTEGVCIQGCEVSENGAGVDSGEANILITAYAAYVKVRYCTIGGEYVSAKEVWGTDGVTFEGAGPGHIVENNEITNMQTLIDDDDDGDGVDIKDTWNRTYYNSSGELEDIVSVVVRNNTISDNAFTGILIHQGAKYIHIYNNLISGNQAEFSGIHIKSGVALYDQLNGVISDGSLGGWGPGLIEKIYIYRNLVVDNAVNGVSIHQPSGETGVEKGDSDIYHGSYDDIQIVNNTIYGNGGLGLAVALIASSDALDYEDVTIGKVDFPAYSFHNLVLANNIYSSNNTGSALPQVEYKDDFSGITDGSGVYRSYLNWIENGLGGDIRKNCYYPNEYGMIIQYQNIDSTETYYNFDTTSTGFHVDFPDVEVDSIKSESEPVDSSLDYITETTSDCVNTADSGIGPYYYGTKIRVPVAPGFDGYSSSDFGTDPDIGAYEVD